MIPFSHRVIIGGMSRPVQEALKTSPGVAHPWTLRDIDFIIKVDDALEISKRLKKTREIHGGYSPVRVEYLERSMVVHHDDGEIEDMILARPGTAYEDLFEQVMLREIGRPWLGCVSVDLDELYTLKMSHRFLKNNPHFKKTMDQIHWLRERGAKIFSESWLAKAEEETYTYKHPSLMREKKDFFSGDGINYVYDHDSIHEAMKRMSKPAYQFFADPNHEVRSSKERFFDQAEIVRLNAVAEETTVLALERSQIPHPKTDPKKSWLMALEKVCTSITSGWFREYAWENYYVVEMMYDPNYVEKFKEKLAQGVVKPHSL